MYFNWTKDHGVAGHGLIGPIAFILDFDTSTLQPMDVDNSGQWAGLTQTEPGFIDTG